jgi:hypothetical protein
MWTDTASIAATASAHALWCLFEDVARWTNWGAGANPRRDPPEALAASKALAAHAGTGASRWPA